ncbi:MAG: O-antigen ligase family protein [Vicinamibacterales bacterium]
MTFGFISAWLLVAAIGLSPRFTAGMIPGGKSLDIRVEDVLLAILLPIALTGWMVHPGQGRRWHQAERLFIAWIVIAGAGVILNALVSDLDIVRGVFFFLKDVEYLCFFVFVAHNVRTRKDVERLVRLMLWVTAVHSAWIAIEVVLGLRWTAWYGPTIFTEPTGPLPSGGFMLLMLLLGLNLWIYRDASLLRRLVPAVFAVAPVLGVWTSGSRASLMGLVTGVVAVALLFALKRGASPRGVGLAAIAAAIFVATSPTLLDSLESTQLGSRRLLNVSEYAYEMNADVSSSRVHIWEGETDAMLERPFSLVLGFGKSYQLTGESHSQYINVLKETGIVGFLVFSGLILVVWRHAWSAFFAAEDGLAVGVHATVLSATVALAFVGITNEVLMVAKVAAPYWVLVGLSIGIDAAGIGPVARLPLAEPAGRAPLPAWRPSVLAR